MREIKFRCWDKTNNRMLPPVDAWGFGEGAETFFDNTLCIYKDEVVLQQYTGLKDMNGVEIYEGDIIQWEDSWDEENVQAELKYGIGKFDGGVYNYVGFYLERDGEILEPYEITNMIQDFNKKYYSYEVIGNIFEGVKE